MGRYGEVSRFFKNQYDLLFKAQEAEERPIHKRGPLHNRGVALFAEERADEAIRSVLLAYVEDTLNVGYDLEDDADRALRRDSCGISST